jgi:hypothetical protein
MMTSSLECEVRDRRPTRRYSGRAVDRAARSDRRAACASIDGRQGAPVDAKMNAGRNDVAPRSPPVKRGYEHV